MQCVICKDGTTQIQIIWLTTTDNIPAALPPEQENLVAAIWSAILRSRSVPQEWRG
jgi:hypothetical protein